MAGRVAGKVAFITGAARGQGRSHAVRLAQEGADIIAVDVCEDMPGMPYAGATEEDLAETVKEVEALDRRIVAAQADVRDYGALKAALDDGIAQLGRLDIVSANAGIGSSPYAAQDLAEQTWQDMLDVNLTGVWHTAKAAVPHLIEGGRGGSIVLTSSAAGLQAYANIAHYVSAKHGVVGLMRTLALELAPHSIRVNSIHPTQVDTPMIQNEATYRLFRPDLEHPTRADFEPASQAMNVLPIPWVDPVNISNAVLFLASDEARYITGVPLPVDAGGGHQVTTPQQDSTSKGAQHGWTSSRQGRLHHRRGPRPGPQPRHPARPGGRGHHRRRPGRPIAACRYPMATPDDLAETVKEVEALDRRIVATQADVRDYAARQGGAGRRRRPARAPRHRVRERRHLRFGTLDQLSETEWGDMIDVNLTGVWHTAKAAIPHLRAAGGGSMILTSSGLGLEGMPNVGHYVTASTASWG